MKLVTNAVFVLVGLAVSFLLWYAALVAIVSGGSNPTAIAACTVGGFVVALLTLVTVSSD
jgi:hypothetical protein